LENVAKIGLDGGAGDNEPQAFHFASQHSLVEREALQIVGLEE